ncbi:MAG: nicotinate (nicotinamide) nucleotide adenylyltransferase [Phycisphaerae bacterium]|nr:nicotinate (nicotinamide) nucleotide adenylyltransferase [Phycisphaerae bacterium]
MADVLLYGGSFDPIHHGHLIVSRAAAEAIGADRIILIPSAIPPHKRQVRLAAGEDRLAMCRLAIAGDSLFEVSGWELEQTGPSYTLLTVRHFREELGAALYWLIGMDSLLELHTWYHVAELADACTLVTVGRPGHAAPELPELCAAVSPAQIERIQKHVLDTPLIQISATNIRERAQARRSIRHLVPEPVREYISAHRLYTD